MRAAAPWSPQMRRWRRMPREPMRQETWWTSLQSSWGATDWGRNAFYTWLLIRRLALYCGLLAADACRDMDLIPQYIVACRFPQPRVRNDHDLSRTTRSWTTARGQLRSRTTSRHSP